MLQTMQNERFELKNATNTVEMAASSSKMLQIAREMDRTGNIKNKTEKTHPQTIPGPFDSGQLPVVMSMEQASRSLNRVSEYQKSWMGCGQSLDVQTQPF